VRAEIARDLEEGAAMAHISLSRGRSTHARSLRALAPPLVAAALGVLVGFAAVGSLVGHAAGDAAEPSLDPARLIDATHRPPLLTLAGERVRLRYDIYCTAPDGDPESGAPCDAGGTVYARPIGAVAWEALPLRLDEWAEEGRYGVDLPEGLADAPAGFEYYAVLRNEANGVSMTLPAGGEESPQRSTPLGSATLVNLGTHAFGETASAAERVFSAPWGSGTTEVGLEGGRQATPIGPAAFDVDARGRVALLDQVNRRLLHIDPGVGRASAVPLAIDGTLADMSVDDDGSVYVLESTGRAAGRPPLLRAFDRAGRALTSVELAERTAAQVRVGPEGPVVKQYPSELWRPALRGAKPLARAEQLAGSHARRPLEDGGTVAVLRAEGEIRVAVDRHGVHRSWLVRSETPLAEVQLAEPYGAGVVLVVRVFTEQADEFEVLVLGPSGARRRFAVDSADWAETAPVTRFRLGGSSLYRLGSNPAGAFVDRFDLGAAS